MSRRMFRGALFDMDGTLISRRDAFRRWAERFYDSQPAMHGAPRGESLRLITEWDAGGDNDKEVFFGRIIARWPGIRGAMPELIDGFWDGLAAAVRPDERALAFLRELNAAGFPWGIVTNGGDYQYVKMRNARLDGLAPFVIVSDDFGCRKPDPRIFREGLRRLGARASETLFVGDNPDTDIRGARAAGMPAAWVRAGRLWDRGQPEPEYQVDHAADLRPLLLGR